MKDSLRILPSEKVLPPKQKLPSSIRWTLRIMAYPFMMLDLQACRIVRFFYKSRYVVEGKCLKRGSCCRFIHMGWPKGEKLTLFHRLYVYWQTEVLGFYFRDFDLMEGDSLTRVMSCRYLQRDGKCAHYRLRPLICRDWPKRPYLKRPVLLKGCGYKVSLRKKGT